MRNEEKISQYCTRQLAINTLSLCLLKSNVARVILLTKFVEAKTTSTNLTLFYLHLHISIRIFCMYSVNFCFVFHGLLQSNCFQMFCSKHSITFENTYLLSCWFHCVDIFYINLRFSETFTIINSVNRIALTETQFKFRTIKCWFTLCLHMHVLD